MSDLQHSSKHMQSFIFINIEISNIIELLNVNWQPVVKNEHSFRNPNEIEFHIMMMSGCSIWHAAAAFISDP